MTHDPAAWHAQAQLHETQGRGGAPCAYLCDQLVLFSEDAGVGGAVVVSMAMALVTKLNTREWRGFQWIRYHSTIERKKQIDRA